MPDQSQALRILLVDDHEASARALARLLRHQGFLVATAYTFAGALALAAPNAVDLLICDVGLPDGDGCELLRQMRAFFGGRTIPAIAVTGHDGLIDKCRKAGYVRCLSKPLRLEDVLEAVRAAYTPHALSSPGSVAPALGGVPAPDVGR
jgi:CheY-like chemotaxis protein